MIQRSTPDLPPEREWSDPLGRADQIIAEVGRQRPRAKRRTGYVVPAIAAAAAAVIAALGVDLLGQPAAPSVVATPPVSETPAATPTAPAHVPTRGSTMVLRVGETAELRHAEITVDEVSGTSRGIAVKVQTCVVDAPTAQFPAGVPVRIGDWLAVRDDHSGVAVAWAQDPDREPAYPNLALVSQGECVAGWMPPMNPPGQGDISLIYHGELGDEARWLLE
ncbi:hypothetical protein [Microlunatus speluncae]|uniref:hypothetical protein n=1 Tax=Microlunatus speluncae TaxID=2594267 RepID=UPI0012666AD1|nr:hypothetical protein [Microlunatus speluncae]